MIRDKQNVYVVHSSHLDLYWIGTQPECLEIGSRIIDDAVNLATENSDFTFLLDTVRFLEYYLTKHPSKKAIVKQLFDIGQFEIAACYTDRLENNHDGESMVRNVLYGKKVLKQILGVDTELAYHPDLPGLAEQSPQIYKKSGVNYYLFARGFVRGSRFWWKGLDDSRIIAYNFPVHYSYYNFEKEIIPFLGEIKREIQAEDVLLSCSAGDLGAANTFVSRDENGNWNRIQLTEKLADLNKQFPNLHFQMSNVKSVLDRMNTERLEVREGEYPSKWGSFGGSANNVRITQMDREVSASLLEAEKFIAICDALDIPIQWGAEPVNPLKHRGGSGGTRNYFELQYNPTNVAEWIDYAWRLQLVTQDHNYGGIGGMQSNFDRYLYKRCAIRIAEKLRDMCFEKIVACIDIEQHTLVVFNSLNWPRTEAVHVDKNLLDTNKSYYVIDLDGHSTPLIETAAGYTFTATNVPSIGYKTFEIKEVFKPPVLTDKRETSVKKEQISVRNSYYELVINRVTGTMNFVKDIELNKVIIDHSDFLSVDLSQDKSFSVSEKLFDKVILESTKQNIRSVEVIEDHALWTKIEIVSEICHAKLVMHIYVEHTKKEIRVKPTLYWIGEGEVQLNLNLGFNPEFKNVHYAVPYGAQKLGNFLDYEKPWAPDEISPELYERYRDSQGWFVMENESMGICVSSNQSSFDFDQGNLRALLLRIVRSGGDQDVMFLNEGTLSWEFRISSYFGSWDNERVYRTSWEQQNPLRLYTKTLVSEEERDLPATAHSFIETEGEGILTVFKTSDITPDTYVARVFNSTAKPSKFVINLKLPVQNVESCDLNEIINNDAISQLDMFEIKSVRVTKQL